MLTLPNEIKPLYSKIESLGHRHNYVTVFDDFLSAMVNFFIPPYQEGFGTDCFKKYEEKERLVFSDMIKETIMLYNRMIVSDNSWYDPFGELYMFLSSKTKSKALGQFFTPEAVVEMMVKMNYSKDMTGKGLRISDPTCGSGRMLIAFHAHCPGNYVFGEDLDLMCCKMSLINLLFHGCEGEIVWHDSLRMDFIKAWKINPNIRKTGLPSIVEIKEEHSVICYNGKLKMQEQVKEPVKLPSQERKKEEVKETFQQLTLF